MVTLGDEGWFAPADGVGDGSYAYSGSEGVDFVKNLAIETLDYVSSAAAYAMITSLTFRRVLSTSIPIRGGMTRPGVQHGSNSTTQWGKRTRNLSYSRSMVGHLHQIITLQSNALGRGLCSVRRG